MTHSTSIIILFVLLSCATSLGQTSFKGLTPGQSTRQDVEGVLGRPVRELSETLTEYNSAGGNEQVFVQYQRDSSIVARIEVAYADAIERSTALRSLNLPPRSTAWQINSKSRLEEYFSAACVVLTYAGADASSGVSRIAYYSRQLFESASAKLPPGSSDRDPPGMNLPAESSAASNSAANNPNNSAASNPGSAPPQPPALKYEDVIAKANGALQAADYQNAIRLSQQAVDIDPNRPQAFEIAGIAQLYGFKDVGAAATAMRAAVQRGGSASFSVTHDHDGFFQSYCQGSLYISSQGVSFRSNDGKHSLAVNRADVKGAGLNSFVGANFYSFHVKVNQNNKSKTYNFAPGMLSAAETNLILELLKNP